jgi:hypothetical protein
MMSSSTKAQSKQLPGVHAALRSKIPLTPQTLLEMYDKPTNEMVRRLILLREQEDRGGRF